MIKWGIIGCGDVTEVKSGPAFSTTPGSELVAVMRRDGNKAADYAQRHGVDHWFDSVDGLLSHDGINAVYVATPPSSHAGLAIKALESGRPVYVEKPMALTFSACQDMIRTAEAKRLPLYVAYYRREMPYFKKAKEIVDSGILGEITKVTCRLIQPPIAGDDSGMDWHTKPEISGGGHFVDLSPHQIDLMIHLFGEVEAFSGMAENRGKRYKAEDYVALDIIFTSGVCFNGVWNFCAPLNEQEDSIVVEGSKGTLRFSTFAMNTLVLETDVVCEYPFEKPSTVQQYLIAEVVENLRKGEFTVPKATYEAAEVTRIIEETLKAYYDKE